MEGGKRFIVIRISIVQQENSATRDTCGRAVDRKLLERELNSIKD
jgi:hypothetical protein